MDKKQGFDAPASQDGLSQAEPEVSALRASIPSVEALHRFVCGQGFGFGEKREPWEYVTAYREAMIADGWEAEPTYPSHEPLESAARLKRDGFVCLMLSRSKGPKEEREERHRGLKQYETKIHIWGPDRLAITPPFPYSFEGCVDGATRCHACGKRGVETQRVNFAGRVCAECLPEQRRLTERPGWCN